MVIPLQLRDLLYKTQETNSLQLPALSNLVVGCSGPVQPTAIPPRSNGSHNVQFE